MELINDAEIKLIGNNDRMDTEIIDKRYRNNDRMEFINDTEIMIGWS